MSHASANGSSDASGDVLCSLLQPGKKGEKKKTLKTGTAVKSLKCFLLRPTCSSGCVDAAGEVPCSRVQPAPASDAGNAHLHTLGVVEAA